MMRKALLLAAGLAIAIPAFAACGQTTAMRRVDQPLGDQKMSVPPDSRVALVIANAKYPEADAPLPHPIKDAQEVKRELERDGFAVTLGSNLSKRQMNDHIRDFAEAIKPGSTALLFFDGLGIQARGPGGRRSYMIPVDAQIWRETDVQREAISIESVLDKMNRKGAGVKLAIIDASRQNPFERRFPLGVSKGLASIDAPEGALILYSDSPGKVTADSDDERDPFVAELLTAMSSPGLTAHDVFRLTKNRVSQRSNRGQVPFVSDSLAEDFYFKELRPADTASSERELPPSETSRKSDSAPSVKASGSTVKASAPSDLDDRSQEPAEESEATGLSRFDGEWRVTGSVVRRGKCAPVGNFTFRVEDGKLEGSLSGRIRENGSLSGEVDEGRHRAKVIGWLKTGNASGNWLKEGGCGGDWYAERG